MKIISSRVSKFNALMTLCALGVTTFGLPAMAAPQEVCVMTSAGDVVCGKPVPKPGFNSNQTSNDVIIDTQQDGFVTWELRSCARNQKKVTCVLSLSSNQDGFYPVYGATRIVDSQGNSYTASLVQFGSDKITGGGNRIGISMARGAHYKTMFEFRDVPVSVSQIILLEAPNGANGFIRFRDISIK